MIDKSKIVESMKKRGLTGVQIAEMLDIGLRSWTRKINGKGDFTASEIEKLCEILKIKNPTPYFFVKELAYNPIHEGHNGQ